MRLIAIDPGKAGGIAWADELKAEAVAMPDSEYGIWELVYDLADTEDDRACVLEHQHNRPPPGKRKNARGQLESYQGRGSTANWTLSGNYHGLRMALIAADLEFEEVSPTKWQKPLGLVFRGVDRLSYEQKKRRHKAEAERIFRGMRVTLATADALLMLEFLRRQLALFTAEPPF
jgi:hypothetical protein